MLLTRLITAPTAEPVSLTEAKAHLRVEHDLDNAFINSMILAARQYAEKICWGGFVTQTWELVRDSFPDHDYICLPKGTLASVTSVKYLESVAGVETTLSSAAYLVDTVSAPPRIRLAFDSTGWPTTRVQYNAVVVRYVVGVAAGEVPAPVKAAILLLMSNMYEFRTAEVLGTIIAKVGFTFDSLLAPYRYRRF